MKIKVPKVVRKMICKHVAKEIYEETGIRNGIGIEYITIDTKGECYTLRMAETISVNKKDLKRFIKESMKKES